jgi:isocitrate dehydrogenase
VAHKITLAKGDGIGPEIMDATLRILQAAEAPLEYDEIEVGEKVYLKGNTSGISNDSWDILTTNKVFLKAPITTPQGGGYKSLNVTIRKSLGLFANIRPVVSYHPFVTTKHPKMDLVIVRENEEDLYAGIEHRQTNDVYQCLKLITQTGSEKIVRYAFEYAVQNNRKKVTCFSKDNIMKMTDGIFHKVFDEVGREYPQIEKEHWIIDIGAAKLADSPEVFEVLVMANLYGDIMSDIAAQIAGSVGLGGSSNIGEHIAMFEAIHGSAPDIAGKNKANPSGLLNATVMMLVHLGESGIAERIHNAWLRTIEDGVHTGDIYSSYNSKKLVGTDEFASYVIENLGNKPSTLIPVEYGTAKRIKIPAPKPVTQKKDLEGVDIFLDDSSRDATAIADMLKAASSDTHLELILITNRGVKVWPHGRKETYTVDHWRCRFISKTPLNNTDLVRLYANITDTGLDIIKTENLYTFDGERGYSLGQGQ